MHIGIAGPISIDSLYDYLDPHENYDRSIGMGGTAINNIIIGLLESGHHVSVYTLDRAIVAPIIMKGKNLMIYIGEYRSRGRDRMKDLFNKEADIIKNFIVKDKPDIVNAHWSYEFALGAIRSKTPHLITLRDDALRILLYRKDIYGCIRFILNAKVMLKGKYFNVNSLYLREKLKMFKGNYEVIHNPILEKHICTKKEIFKDEIRLVSVLTGWGERKNPKPALKAFKLLYDKFGEKVSYSIYGSDYGVGEICHQWAIKNKLDKNVNFNGAIPHHLLMKELEKYHILLHPAKEESFGNMLIEGMAKGLAVIGGNNSGAVPEVLNFGKNGELTDINSPTEIYKSIEKLINDSNYFKTLSKKGMDFVRENYSSSAIAQKYLKKYKKILSQ